MPGGSKSWSVEEMKHVRGIGQLRRLHHIISILRVHVARQCGATDSVEEVREISVAESGGAVQMERMEHLVSRKARPRVQDKRPHVGRPRFG